MGAASIPGYRRPDIEPGTYLDAEGRVIPYGHRWSGMPDESMYSVSPHPERFQPVAEAARALTGALAALDRGDGAPIELEITDFPGVIAHVGHQVAIAFPQCGCDACDDDVVQLVDDLENLVDAVVAGRFREGPDGSFGYEGDWGSHGAGRGVSPSLADWPEWRGRTGPGEPDSR